MLTIYFRTKELVKLFKYYFESYLNNYLSSLFEHIQNFINFKKNKFNNQNNLTLYFHN